jgi:hypothetical protein
LRTDTDAKRVIQPFHCDLARRKFELRVLQRGAHAIARLSDLGVGQTNQLERRQPARNMNFDGDQWAARPESPRESTTESDIVKDPPKTGRTKPG